MFQLRIDLLTDEIFKHFAKTSVGHCARVDFLERQEALAICKNINNKQHEHHIVARVLTTDITQLNMDPIFISTDQAIEIRNRKHSQLCLFVPSERNDAALSSLANSFAEIDARQLQSPILKHLLKNTSLASVQSKVQETLSQIRNLKVSKDQQINFICAVIERTQNGDEQIGLDLWHLGLITDARTDFHEFLSVNRQRMFRLARPAKFHATTRERIQDLGVDTSTAVKLVQFFQNRALHNVPEWSKELIDHNLTLDQWTFREEPASDIRSVTVLPFFDRAGKVEKYSKLEQPNGPGSDLRAYCGPKRTLAVHWKCDPPKPQNLSYWRVEVLPSVEDLEEDIEFELPRHREVLGKYNKATIKLDIELEEQLDFSVVIRVTPLDAARNEIKTEEEGKPISDEFFLFPEQGTMAPTSTSKRESRAAVSTLTYGRLEAAMRAREDTLLETEPHWSTKDLEYFSIKQGERHTSYIGLSSVLKALEKQVISDPRTGGCFVLTTDEVLTVESDACVARKLIYSTNETWLPLWKAREHFFQRLRKDEPRDVIEAANWTPELAGAATRYAQAYNDLLQELSQPSVSREEVLEALSLDTILIRVKDGTKGVEEALVVLPTHPLRTAWFANYTQLLRKWEETLLELTPRDRKSALDMDSLRLLVPTNVPAFAFHCSTTLPFVFFQNLRFFHSVHLPANTADPHRRFADIATILGAELDQIPVGDIQPEKLAEHLQNFQEMHPYATTLTTTLLNPDRGEFFAEAIKKLLQEKRANDSFETIQEIPKFHITSYVEDERRTTVQALEQIRQIQHELEHNSSTDYFVPGLMTTLRGMPQLQYEPLPDAHIAVVTDFTRPSVTTITQSPEGQDDTKSFALYGLINRFIPQFMPEQDGFVWRYQIVSDGSKLTEPHPVRPQYSDVLVNLHTALLSAGGKILSGDAQARPILEVHLEPERQRLLEQLHNSSNWVITLDRFFALDYYDSPHVPSLGKLANKYVLDYSPEFSEGLGHRMMVTTSWHEEIGSLLHQAMEEQGFAALEESVSSLLHYLKTVSGSLALQALESTTQASAAVGLGVVTAWLQKEKRLSQSVLIPVDLHPRLFSRTSSDQSSNNNVTETIQSSKGNRRCDLVLISLKRNIVKATFIEVKWRRGQTSADRLAADMVLQMESSRQVMESRFFNRERIDGALQRSYLANVLRFYFERSRRYQLFDPKAEASFLDHLTKLEKDTLEFQASYEGYIVSLDSNVKKRIETKEAKIRVLTANDFAQLPDFQVLSSQMPLFEKDVSEDLSDVSTSEDEDRQKEETQEDSEELPDTVKIIATQEAEHALDLAEEAIIPLGEATGGSIDWKPSTKGSPHLFIVGIPGQGKSWATIRLLTELGKQGIPSLVLDFHGQFADNEGHFVQTIHPTVIDAAEGLPFSPFESTLGNERDNWKANAYALADIFGYVGGLGDIQQDALYQAIRDAYIEKGFNKATTGDLEYPTLEDVLSRLEKQEKGRHGTNVIARCRPLLEMDLFRPVQGSPNLLSQIRKGLVIALHNLQQLEKTQLAAGAFVLRKLYKDMFSWGQTDRIRLAIVLDEAHRLARDVTLPKIMKEGRKFGIAVIVASQGMDDFHPDVLETAGTKIIFRTNYPQSKKIAGFIRARSGQDISSQIEQLSVGTAYVQTPDMQYGLKVRMYPLL